MKKIVVLPIAFLCFSISLLGQTTQTQTQILKGIVIDKDSEKPLEGASVTLIGYTVGATTNSEGKFTLLNVPLGRQRVAVEFTGYKQVVIPEILVTAGKEVIVDVSLEQYVSTLEEVTVKTNRIKKGAVSNEYAVASGRSFNMDEVTRFSGGRNDPSKLVSNFAGVISNNDARNDIVVRGNSPSGVLWRIEGIPSANPNHFASFGTTGGPVTILNTNALKTSDFLSGAFPAEFGNATAAVFDIQLRNGNSDKHERTLQFNAFSGFEAMLEGPLTKKDKESSYMLGYRYSFVEIGKAVGINIGTNAIPKYQDWVYNFSFAKGKTGKWNLYGMGGFSDVTFIGSEIDATDFYVRQDQDSYFKSRLNIIGVKHIVDINSKAYVKTTLSYTNQKAEYSAYQYPLPVPPYQNRWLITQTHDVTNTFRVVSYINSKENTSLSWRAGITGELFHLQSKFIDREGQPGTAPFNVLRNYNDNFILLQAFGQTKYKLNDELSVVAGLHGMWFTFNKSSSLEPRLSFNYQVTPSTSMYASYGLHAQLLPFPIYLYEEADVNGKPDKSNQNLDFTKAHHFVLGYENRFLKDWRVKAELYYQRLFNVPVEKKSSGFSMLNAGDNFVFPNKAGLVNKGTGSNTGIEITLEKFLSKGYYLLFTTSFFDSKYKGSDNIRRNTSFNYGKVFNLLTGKEWKIGKQKNNALTFDIRLSSVGGRYITPVDLTASIAAGKEILNESKFNTERLDGYFRLDTKFGWRINSRKRKLTQTFYFDIQNITDKQNIFLRRFNALRGTVGNVNQLGFFPDVMYRLQF